MSSLQLLVISVLSLTGGEKQQGIEILPPPGNWQAIPLKFKLTAYCNEGTAGCRTCNGKWAKYNQTASGKTPRWGMIAADPRVLPLGTKVWIAGLGTFVVEDTGSAIKGNRIDIFFGRENGAHQRAFKFGAPTRLVWIEKRQIKKPRNQK